VNRAVQAILVGVLLLALGFLWLWRQAEARRPRGTNEAQIAGLLESARQAALRGDVSGVLHGISRHYRDSNGMGYANVAYQVRRTLSRMEEIQVETRIVRLYVDPGGATATVDLYVKLTGRPDIPPAPLDQTLSLTLTKEPVRYYVFFSGSEWRVTSASGYGGY